MGAAAAVDDRTFAAWRIADPGLEVALYGRRDVAEGMGGVPSVRPREIGRDYVRFMHPEKRDLPALLGAYLVAYSRTWPDA